MHPRVLLAVWTDAGIPPPVAEYRFHPERMWRFDWAWPDQKVAAEFDGGIWINGGHNRGSGYKRDTEKRNEAAALGWRIIRCEPRDATGRAFTDLILRTLKIQRI